MVLINLPRTMDRVNEILEGQDAAAKKLISVDKAIDVEIDEGTLLVTDYNSFNLKRGHLDSNLKDLSRGNVQLLVNKIWELPTKCVEEVIVAQLPKQEYVLPRSRKLPKPKPLTKWQQFAKEKGITPRKKGKSKLKWDDLLQKWTPAYGFKKAEAEKQKEWLVECNDDGKPKDNSFAAVKVGKQEKKAKNELQRLRNLAKAKKVQVPKVGLPSSEHLNAKHLSTGAKVADVSTASLGRFNAPAKTEVKKKQKSIKKGRVTKKRNKNPGQLRESAPKTTKKPKAGKGNRDFRTKVGGRKRRG